MKEAVFAQKVKQDIQAEEANQLKWWVVISQLYYRW